MVPVVGVLVVGVLVVGVLVVGVLVVGVLVVVVDVVVVPVVAEPGDDVVVVSRRLCRLAANCLTAGALLPSAARAVVAVAVIAAADAATTKADLARQLRRRLMGVLALCEMLRRVTCATTWLVSTNAPCGSGLPREA